nr:MAG TPA_asm: holin [Caudoviricetes sp.]
MSVIVPAGIDYLRAIKNPAQWLGLFGMVSS